MAIITKPSSIVKNVPALFSLDKTALAAVSSVAANPWYGDTNNWNSVTLNYLSQQYGEMLFVRFDATQASPTASWLAPAICQDIFEIVSISITDFANGTFRVPTSELNPSEFLVDMSPAPLSGIAWESKVDYTSEPDGGVTSTNTNNAESSILFAQSPISTSTDFTITYNIFSNDWVPYVFIGYSNQLKSVFSGFYRDTNYSSVLVNNSLAFFPLSLPTGGVVAELKIQKVGLDVFFKVNGVTVYTALSSVLDALIYPAVRLMQGNVNITTSFES